MTTKERKQLCEWIATEINSGGSLASGLEDKAWNSATFRASNIAKKYGEGKGLFQIGEPELKE